VGLGGGGALGYRSPFSGRPASTCGHMVCVGVAVVVLSGAQALEAFQWAITSTHPREMCWCCLAQPLASVHMLAAWAWMVGGVGDDCAGALA
jgi:hypothetical protein